MYINSLQRHSAKFRYVYTRAHYLLRTTMTLYACTRVLTMGAGSLPAQLPCVCVCMRVSAAQSSVAIWPARQ